MKWENNIEHGGKLVSLYSKNYPKVVELFSAAWCNLNCNYCTVPKGHSKIGEIDENIIEKAKDGSFIEEIYNFYGTALEILSHWGSEPTLTIHHFIDFYKEAFKTFPYLKSIVMSSNFLANISNLKSFVEFLHHELEGTEREENFTLNIQVSLDGPEWITDRNRKKDGTKKIIENLFSFIKYLNELKPNFKINFKMKPTVGSEMYLTLAERLEEYYSFFNDIFKDFDEINSLRNVNFSKGVPPTIVFPTKATQQDGLNFSYLFERHQELNTSEFRHINGPYLPYLPILDKLQNVGDEFFTKHYMFTCSAGDSQFGLLADGSISLCHDAFYTAFPEFDSIMEVDRDMIKGTEKYTRDSLINKPMDVNINFIRTIRSFHDFSQLKLSITETLIRELCYSNQINKVYEKEYPRKLLAFFLNMISCPYNNKSIWGSYMISDKSAIKLFGNGVFEQLVRRKYENSW